MNEWGGSKLEQPEKAIILGTYRGKLWFRFERAAGNDGVEEGAALAWYLDDFEFPGLTLESRGTSASTEPVTVTAADPTKPAKGPQSASLSSSLPGEGKLDYFAEIAMSNWAATEDLALVHFVNIACSRSAIDPINLAATRLASALAEAEEKSKTDEPLGPGMAALLKRGKEAVLARFCVLVELNQLATRCLPYVSFRPTIEPCASVSNSIVHSATPFATPFSTWESIVEGEVPELFKCHSTW